MPHRCHAVAPRSCMSSTDKYSQKQTFHKYVAMETKLTEFYSTYEGQTWKNVLSFGDMPYEYNAIQDVTFRHKAPPGKQENVRTKCFLWQSAPGVSETALRLRFHKTVLPAYVHFDG